MKEKLTSNQQIAGLVLILVAIPLLALSVFCSRKGVQYAYAKMPEPFIVNLELPDDAEILPAEQVEAGTFKINLDISDWLSKAATKQHPERPIVTYTKRYGPVDVRFWLPRKDGTFYYSEISKSPPNWLSCFYLGNIKVVGNQLIVNPVRFNEHYYLFFMAFVSGLIALLCFARIAAFLYKRA